MEWIDTFPVWALALAIFCLRVLDVSLGTIRVISIVHGRAKLSIGLGFFEILIWVSVLSGLLVQIGENPGLALAYAGGFAVGNAVGIQLERKIAMGSSIALIISREKGLQIAQALRETGQRLTTVEGSGRDGPRTLLYVTTSRRRLPTIINTARKIDSQVFYVVDHCSETSYSTQLAETALGWGAFFKKK